MINFPYDYMLKHVVLKLAVTSMYGFHNMYSMLQEKSRNAQKITMLHAHIWI